MQLKECRIGLIPSYEANAGQYAVSISYVHEKSHVDMALPPEIGNALLAVVSQHILRASQETANRLHNSIASSILEPPIEVKQLDQPEAT